MGPEIRDFATMPLKDILVFFGAVYGPIIGLLVWVIRNSFIVQRSTVSALKGIELAMQDIRTTLTNHITEDVKTFAQFSVAFAKIATLLEILEERSRK